MSGAANDVCRRSDCSAAMRLAHATNKARRATGSSWRLLRPEQRMELAGKALLDGLVQDFVIDHETAKVLAAFVTMSALDVETSR